LLRECDQLLISLCVWTCECMVWSLAWHWPRIGTLDLL